MTALPFRWFQGLPAIVRGYIWMFLGTVAFGSMVVIVRELSQLNYNAFEMTFWRALIGLALLVPVIARQGAVVTRTKQPGLQIARNAIHFAGVAAWFFALSHINLSQGVALQFTVPLFTILIAVLLLKEKVDTRRLIATFTGFAGVLIIVRPGFADITPYAYITIISALSYALSNVQTKMLVKTDSSDAVVFYMNLVHLPLAIAGALAIGWHVPPLADIPILIALAICATLAHYFYAQGFRQADASRLIPMDFMKLPTVSILAFLLFAEVPDPWAWAGGAVIFFAVWYIVRREARLASEARS